MIKLIIVVLILQAYFCFRLYRCYSIHPILAGAIICNTVFWYFTPGFIALTASLDISEYLDKNVISDNYVVLYSLESVLYLCAVAVGTRIFKTRVTKDRHIYRDQLSIRLSVTLVIMFITLVIVKQIIFGQTDYLVANAASKYDETSSYFFLTLVSNLLLAAVVYIAATVRNNFRVLLFSNIALLISVYFSVLGGSRIALMLPVFIFIVRALSDHKNLSAKRIWLMVFSFVFLVAFALPISNIIAELRTGGHLNYSEVFNDHAFDINASAAAITLFTKFNSVSNGLQLIDGYGAGSAGFTPYIGSALLFLPRAFFPSRPVAGSIDGTLSGTPARLVPALNVKFSDSMNVGVSPLAISIWQFGWLFGSVLLLLSGILNLYIINYLFLRSDFIYKVLATNMISVPTFVGIFSSPDVVLKNLVFLFFTVGALKLAKKTLTF